MTQQSARAQIVERRTYLRPTNKDGTEFETREQAWTRVISHQRWLWERAQDKPLDTKQEAELAELRELFIASKATVSGRTRWLGGTDIAKTREASQFNCSFGEVQTVHDVVDTIWLLLQGCGVGFRANVGVLNGFTQPVELEIIRSPKVIVKDENGKNISDPSLKGKPNNREFFNKRTGVWTIKVGDSAEAWAKLFGKILAFKKAAKKLVVDFSEIRPAGYRLSGYGWISSGDSQIATALEGIVGLMNDSSGKLLTAINILDLENYLGTILSSRRSAEIALYPYGGVEWEEFANAKKDHDTNGKWHRGMSNNSLLFYNKPTKSELANIFKMMAEAGGSEPGFINAGAALRRAPHFKGVNPCITGDTWVETDGGPVRVTDLIDKPFVASVNGMSYPATGFWKTGDKTVYTISTNRGQELRATADHKFLVETRCARSKVSHNWVELKDLKEGDDLVLDDRGWIDMIPTGRDDDLGWLLGEIVGDGGHNPESYPSYVRFWGDSAAEMAAKAADIVKKYLEPSHRFKGPSYNSHNKTWQVSCNALTEFASIYLEDRSKRANDLLEQQSLNFTTGFVRGMFDSDGCVQGNLIKGVSIRLDQVNLPRLEMVQRMLLRLGMVSTIYNDRKSGVTERMLPDTNRNLKMYPIQMQHSLVLSKTSFKRFVDVVGFNEPAKMKRAVALNEKRARESYRDRYNTTIVSIIESGVEAVYDVTVTDTHRFVANGIVIHNCAEILLGDKSFCNLVEVAISRFNSDSKGLMRALYLVGRANYRQTCVNLDDGVLQKTWHELNEFLRLCGVGLTGIIGWEHHKDGKMFAKLREFAQQGCNSMADELGLPRPKLVTTIKPSGTQSKVFGLVGDEIGEGAHRPLAKYLFNRINFSVNDPMLDALKDAGYITEPNPYDTTSRLVVIPVAYENIDFDEVVVDGERVEVNLESAIDQLERYKLLQENYVDHNCSITIYYSPSESGEIMEWLLSNWDSYVGVSFLYRPDPVEMVRDPEGVAKSLGYPYLPQTPVTKSAYDEYFNSLVAVDFSGTDQEGLLDLDECASGSCPVR